LIPGGIRLPERWVVRHPLPPEPVRLSSSFSIFHVRHICRTTHPPVADNLPACPYRDREQPPPNLRSRRIRAEPASPGVSPHWVREPASPAVCHRLHPLKL